MENIYSRKGLSRERRAGVLLHVTSLPGEFKSGDIGHQAYRFIEFLSAHGFKIWQMLPLGPTHDDRSPYQCLSAHAGNPLLISLDWLVDRQWLIKSNRDAQVDDDVYRKENLKLAYKVFKDKSESVWMDRFETFRFKHQLWLEDYSLFTVIKEINSGLPWYDWPEDYKHRENHAIKKIKVEFSDELAFVEFEQFVFYTQWQEIREYARKHSVELFGDMPIFVARDSADVWAYKECFLMNKEGEMKFVAGVPPDAFSETGQRWGNPLYDWEYLQQTQFEWWLSRFESQLEQFDILRIDHFRGLEACWHIPADDPTAISGFWELVPGKELLSKLFERFEYLPLIAEDLGVITESVIELKHCFDIPGMKVLQFAYDGNNENPHLPHCHHVHDIVYSGTHDNDTTLGWVLDNNSHDHKYFMEYSELGNSDAEKSVINLIRQAMMSVSFISIIPMQDLLMLDGEARMNLPGTTVDNWQWRFEWSQVRHEIVSKITQYIQIYQR